MILCKVALLAIKRCLWDTFKIWGNGEKRKGERKREKEKERERAASEPTDTRR